MVFCSAEWGIKTKQTKHRSSVGQVGRSSEFGLADGSVSGSGDLSARPNLLFCYNIMSVTVDWSSYLNHVHHVFVYPFYHST